MAITPKDVADDCMRRARELMALAKSGTVAKAMGDDLARLALVMGVAALDAFMHAAVLRSANAAKLPSALARVNVPFSVVARLAGHSVAARKTGIKNRPWIIAKRALQERLLQETFQSYQAIAHAMRMAGVTDGWNKVAAAAGWKREDLEAWLGTVVHRRNCIVHEGDLRRLLKPQTISHWPIDVGEVEKDLCALEDLLRGLQSVLP